MTHTVVEYLRDRERRAVSLRWASIRPVSECYRVIGWQVRAMTSRRSRVDARASLLLILIVADMILVGRTTAARLRHRQTSPFTPTTHQTPPRTRDRDQEQPADHADEALRPQPSAGGRPRHRRHRLPAAERVVVPDYMWQLYRRQRRANRERQHHRSDVTSDFTPSQYTANTIRSFVATPHDDRFTGK